MLLSLARLQDQPGRCGPAVTSRPRPAAAIRCKEHMAAGPQMTSVMAAKSRGLDCGEPAAMGVNVAIDTRAGACDGVMDVCVDR